VTPNPPPKMNVEGLQVAVEGDPVLTSEDPILLKLSTKLRISGKWVVKVGSETLPGDVVVEGTPRLRVSS